MKKVIAILIFSTLLTSCLKTEETIVETENPNPNVEETIVEEGTIEENNAEDENTETNTEKESAWEIDDVMPWNTEEKENNGEVTTEEEVLDAEINNLLDEFIDSLDSYDK